MICDKRKYVLKAKSTEERDKWVEVLTAVRQWLAAHADPRAQREIQNKFMSEKDRLSKQLQELEHQTASVDEQLQSEKKASEELRKKYEQSLADYKEVEDQKFQLIEKCDILEDDLAIRNEKIEQLTKENTGLIETQNQLQNELNEEKAKMKQLESQRIELEENNAELRDSLKKIEEKAIEREIESRNLSREVEGKDREIQELKENAEELNKQIADLKLDIEQTKIENQKKLELVNQELQQKSRMLDAQTKDNAELKRRLEEAQKSIKYVENEKLKLQNESTVLNDKIQRLEETLKAAGKYDGLEKENIDLKTKLQAMKLEEERLIASSKALAQENFLLTVEMRSNAAEYEKKLVELEKSLTDKHNQMLEIIDQENTRRTKTLKENIEALTQKNNQLNKSLEETRKAKNQTLMLMKLKDISLQKHHGELDNYTQFATLYSGAVKGLFSDSNDRGRKGRLVREQAERYPRLKEFHVLYLFLKEQAEGTEAEIEKVKAKFTQQIEALSQKNAQLGLHNRGLQEQLYDMGRVVEAQARQLKLLEDSEQSLRKMTQKVEEGGALLLVLAKELFIGTEGDVTFFKMKDYINRLYQLVKDEPAMRLHEEIFEFLAKVTKKLDSLKNFKGSPLAQTTISTKIIDTSRNSSGENGFMSPLVSHKRSNTGTMTKREPSFLNTSSQDLFMQTIQVGKYFMNVQDSPFRNQKSMKSSASVSFIDSSFLYGQKANGVVGREASPAKKTQKSPVKRRSPNVFDRLYQM